jgi:hypothetical protein
MAKLGLAGQKGVKRDHQPAYPTGCARMEPVATVSLLWDKNPVFYKQENVLLVRNISNI